jgi:hypothetical protein
MTGNYMPEWKVGSKLNYAAQEERKGSEREERKGAVQ